MSIQQLLELASPPKNPIEVSPPNGWINTERQLGLQLPTDYKSLLDHYGTGTFNDAITPYTPFSQIEYLNLFDAVDTYRQADRQTQLERDPSWTAVHPFQLYPVSGGLLPWGITSQFGKVLFWKTHGAADAWETILYNLKNGEYEVWKMPATQLLIGLLSDTIQSVLFSENNFGYIYFKSQKTNS